MTDEERTVVKTYVPRSQKEAWVEHAESLDMSQSEFLRTMVQAGRRGFDPDPAEASSPDVTPRGQGLEERVRSALAESGVLDWDEVVARVAGDVERDVDEALGRLQERGAVRYSGRDGGYVLTGDRRAARRDADGDSRRPRGEGEERATGDRDDRPGGDGGPAPEGSRRGRRNAPARSRRSPDDHPREDGPRNEASRRPRRQETPRNGSRDGPRRDDARRPRRENDRRPREDRQRPANGPRREDRHPPVESLREARESLDDPERRENERDGEAGDGHRTERVTDEERYDER